MLDTNGWTSQAGEECCDASNSGVEGYAPWRRLAAPAQLSSGRRKGAAKRVNLAAPHARGNGV